MANNNRSLERETFWRDVLARFRGSGLSVRAFCRQEKLAETAFYFWRRTLAERDGTPTTKSQPTPKRRAARPAFLPVAIRRDAPTPTSGLALELPSGIVLRFNDTTPAERVAALVRALEGGT